MFDTHSSTAVFPRYLSWLVVMLLLGAQPALAQPVQEPVPQEPPGIQQESPSLRTHTPDLKDVERFTQVYQIIQNAYVEKLDNQKLIDAAIRGMLQQIDPHSAYLDAKQRKQMQEETSGRYTGIGVKVGKRKHRLVIIAPIDESPAAKAGIKAGDVIIDIDGKAVDPGNLQQSIDQLRGKKGTSITLTLLPKGQDKPITKTLKRQKITTKSVRLQTLSKDYVYIRISQFQRHTGTELYNRLKKYIKRHGQPKGALLDLRANPGGLVTSAVASADIFLDKGTIVSMRGRHKKDTLAFRAHHGDLLEGAPMVVLVDAGTASAAEILSGALKDHQRALVVGQTTFGKGVVQTLWDIDAEHALKLTTQRYYTPNGQSIQAEGIHPDIVIDDMQVSAQDDAHHVTSEADLPNHLVNQSHSDKTKSKKTTPAHHGAPENTDNDYVKAQAFNILQGLVLGKHKSANTSR